MIFIHAFTLVIVLSSCSHLIIVGVTCCAVGSLFTKSLFVPVCRSVGGVFITASVLLLVIDLNYLYLLGVR